MSDEIEVILLPEPLLPRALHLPLELDDILAQYESRLKEAHEHPRRNGHEMLVAPRIANQDGAVLVGLQDAHALTGDEAHLPIELGDAVHARKPKLRLAQCWGMLCIPLV